MKLTPSVTYKNDAVTYSSPGDEIDYYMVRIENDYFALDIMAAIRLMLNGYPDIIDWCEATFGPSSDDTWSCSYYDFLFRNEADRTMFILRWS